LRSIQRPARRPRLPPRRSGAGASASSRCRKDASRCGDPRGHESGQTGTGLTESGSARISDTQYPPVPPSQGDASMAARPPTREELIQQDIQELHRLGYAQQLFREMGGFSNFAISFSIISILTGAVLLYGYGLKFAGPIINSVGWPLVSLLTLCVAASMAELASAYPTAGGLYFWAFRLGGRTWAWSTAWLNMIGQITITAGINIAAS